MTIRLRTLGIHPHPGCRLDDMLELTELAERAGLTAVGLGDNGYAEIFALMGAVATRTRTIELVSCVATWTRTPVTTAVAAQTVAEFSHGRFTLGFGAMPKQWSEDFHGIAYARPVERMRDYVAAVRAAIAARPDAPAYHDGPFYTINGYAPFETQSVSSVPIYLGVTLPKMTELAGEVCEGVVINSMHSAEWTRDMLWPSIDAGLARSGRTRADFNVGVRVYCAIRDDEAEAIDLLRPALGFFVPVPYFQHLMRHHGFDDEIDRAIDLHAKGDRAAMLRAISDDMVRTVCLVGDADQVRDQMRRYEDIADFLLFSAPRYGPTVFREQTEKIIETFAPVVPGLAAARSGSR